MKLTMIRHTSVEVPQGICYGQTDVPLKATFEQEAAITARELKEFTFDKVYVSPLSRCVRLAEYCGYPHAIKDNRIKELDFGKWEMQKFSEISDPRLHEWYNDYFNVATTGGESFQMQLQRVSEFLEELKQKEPQHIAVFAHGGVLLCAQIYAGVIQLEEAFNKITPYGGIIHLSINH